MKTYPTQVQIGVEHIDKGDHANWIAQLAIAQDVHFAFREELGFGLEELKEEHELFLVMKNVKDVFYHKQLRLGDIIDVEITVWISSPARLAFQCTFRKGEEIATEMSWVMPLVSIRTERPCKIPQWMIDVIGLEKLETLRLH